MSHKGRNSFSSFVRTMTGWHSKLIKIASDFGVLL
jgi:hypothetical protein